MMKILFCSPCPLNKEFGAAKTLIELSEELEQIGWDSEIVSPEDLTKAINTRNNGHYSYAERLRQYLKLHATKYDIVEYDHGHLPFSRSEFHKNTLFVARSQLLGHHFNSIQVPEISFIQDWKSNISSLIDQKNRREQQRINIQYAHTTIVEADLVTVLNQDDKLELIKHGICEKKIVVIPNGLSRISRPLFDAIPVDPPLKPKVVFIGSFGNRKGAADFPGIVRKIYDQIPEVSFRLLGTAGIYRTKKEVLSCFPKKHRHKIEVIPHFDPDILPRLLSSCSVGIFPSYIEGFGLGVLEMLSASIPVVAYDSPGPPMMLSSEYLVPRGDILSMSNKVVELLKNQEKLQSARILAKNLSQKFCWQKIAKLTSDIYSDYWQQKQIDIDLQI